MIELNLNQKRFLFTFTELEMFAKLKEGYITIDTLGDPSYFHVLKLNDENFEITAEDKEAYIKAGVYDNVYFATITNSPNLPIKSTYLPITIESGYFKETFEEAFQSFVRNKVVNVISRYLKYEKKIEARMKRQQKNK